MQPRHALLTITLALAALAGSAARAQSSASHALSVSIPQVLRLALDGAPAGTAGADGGMARLGLEVEVARAGATVRPSSTGLAVFANAGWSLQVRLEGPASGPSVAYRLAGHAPVRMTAYDRQVAAGGPTHGWHPLTVAYQAEAAGAADGSYALTVVYTLAQP